MMTPYEPLQPVLTRDIEVRGLRYRVNCWGDPLAPPLVLLHGWADTGLSFQFLADEMAAGHYCIAPDWRGFGDSGWAPGGYWFPDYLADLDVLLDLLLPGRPVALVGHSMGGNVAWLYAGSRPARVSHVVGLDAFGLRESNPDDAPARYRQWLDEIGTAQRFSVYADIDAARDKVLQLAPDLAPERALFIAESWTRRLPDGTFGLRHDARHKRVNPVLFRRTEAKACWQRITAPVLLILARHSFLYTAWDRDGAREEVHGCIPGLCAQVLDGGHMLHLEQPRALAAAIDTFLRQAITPAQ